MGGPAAKNGVSIGWKILSVNEIGVRDKSYSDIRAILTNASMPVTAIFQKPPDYGLMVSSDTVTVNFMYKEGRDGGSHHPFGMTFGTEAESRPGASDLVTSWRRAARAWIRRQDLKDARDDDLMEEACNRIDIDANHQISEFEFHQVCLMLDGTEANKLEKKMAALGPNKKRCEYSNKIFRLMDDDESGWLSKRECFLSLQWLKDQLRLIGPPHLIVANFDTDRDGKLQEEEFSRIGGMLTPQLNEDHMGSFFKELDIDPKDNFVTERELTFEEECSHPVGCGNNSKSLRKEIADTELKQYHHVPAIIEGRVTVSVEVPKGAPIPPEDKLAKTVSHQFIDAFSSATKTSAKLQSTSVFPKGSLVKPLEHDMWTRFVVVNFELDAEDGGGFQDLLRANSEEINNQCLKKLAQADWKKSWMQLAAANMWGRLSASYYSSKVANAALPAQRMTLYQDFGKMPSQKTPLLARPYIYIAAPPVQDQ